MTKSVLDRLLRRSNIKYAYITKLRDWWSCVERYYGHREEWTSVYWACIDADMQASPEMCQPEKGLLRITARLTKPIEIPTRPLPSVDVNTPTIAEPAYWLFCNEYTERINIVDKNATEAMDLEAILR